LKLLEDRIAAHDFNRTQYLQNLLAQLNDVKVQKLLDIEKNAQEFELGLLIRIP
jgi:hypothetical protein